MAALTDYFAFIPAFWVQPYSEIRVLFFLVRGIANVANRDFLGRLTKLQVRHTAVSKFCSRTPS